MTDTAHPYGRLTPDVMMAAVESCGIQCDGRFLALNSFENRVFQIGVEDNGFLVAKFYRPGRWSDDQILEEHAFTAELAQGDLSFVAPISSADGTTLHHHQDFRFALFPRRGGRAPMLDNADHLRQLGRFLGRTHRIGAAQDFEHRPELDIESFGMTPIRYLRENNFIPMHLETAYDTLVPDALKAIRHCFERAGAFRRLRLHGDFHPGNVLWLDDGPHVVDLDDCRHGPAIQDLWMLLSGEREEQEEALGWVLEGYTQFAEFNPAELHLVEALRTLRIIHFHGWIARRWDDPAFPIAFPWFGDDRCFEQLILDLRAQIAAMSEPPLSIPV